jgi:colanic acid biosynthesis glycosyl transferase WcaI
LYLSPFFFPEAISTGKYNSLVVQALVDHGVEVDVVCSHPFYPAWRPLRSNGILAGTTIHRGGAWMRYPHSIVLRRALLELWFAWHALLNTWRLRKEPAIAVAIFPPSLFFILITALLPDSSRKIGIVHDLQGRLGLGHGGFLKSVVARLVRAVEKKALRCCDTLIMLSDSMARRAMQDYDLDSHRIVVCYPFVTVRQKTPGTNLERLFAPRDQHVVYSGALGKKQNPSGLFQFFCAATQRLPKTHFHIFSDGPEVEKLRQRHLVAPADRIHFHSLVSEVDLEELYARSTVQLIPQLDETSDACLPSKLPNILATGCLLLAICQPGTELAQLIEQTGAGVVAYSWNMDELIAKLECALNQARSQTPEQRQALVSDLLKGQFSLEVLVSTLLGGSNAQTASRSTDVPEPKGLRS